MIHFANHSHHHFGSYVIRTQEQFDDFVKRFDAHAFWDEPTRAAFHQDFKRDIVDFRKEALVLIQWTKSMGVRWEFKPFEMRGDTLVSTIYGEVSPKGAFPMHMEDHYALAVRKDKVRQVEVRLITVGPDPNDTATHVLEVLPINGKPR